MSTIDTKQNVALVGRIISNGNRRFISVPADSVKKVDDLGSKRALVTLQALP